MWICPQSTYLYVYQTPYLRVACSASYILMLLLSFFAELCNSRTENSVVQWAFDTSTLSPFFFSVHEFCSLQRSSLFIPHSLMPVSHNNYATLFLQRLS